MRCGEWTETRTIGPIAIALPAERERQAGSFQGIGPSSAQSILKAVNRRRAHPKAARGLGHAEQIFLDPSWTQRFVFLRCGMGDSGTGLR